ncbi:hypothetical protein [Streptomyces lomondensis]|uniref:Uncharacterized protein n=1 Tax=Streptomyces lomondensis TaxID=68229 RepID=A0ABQ2XX41_9ACTN|nr:hypothetical protein [Streptomyces lomondensis]MCF0083241.1 hypothetical protein [Streptomyces lomondensis]GGX36992.1 hypothetical protein GCM10010383_78690 [Streptomyces lomondensis]
MEEFHRAAEDIRITRKTLLDPTEPVPPAPPPPQLPDHPAYHTQYRQQCPSEAQAVVERGILVETEQDLFTQPRP